MQESNRKFSGKVLGKLAYTRDQHDPEIFHMLDPTNTPFRSFKNYGRGSADPKPKTTQIVRFFCTSTQQGSEQKKPAGRVYKPGTIKEITKPEELDKYMTQRDKHVIVSFFTDNCEGCKKVIPRFQERAAKVTKDFDIVKVDLYQFDSLAEKFQVEFAPHAFVYYNGKKIGEFKGVASDEELDNFFKPLLSK